MIDSRVASSPARNATILTRILRIYITMTLPVILVVTSVRLVMTPVFLQFEYTRPGFPDDPYGFSLEDRLHFAPYAVDYLLNGEDITYLSSLRFADGGSIFNVRELQHMRDVKWVTQIIYPATVLAGAGAAVAAYLLRRDRATHGELRTGLRNGGIATLGLIGMVVLAALINWDFFFTGFHSLFFETGTWRFAYSDTLIRLFPEQFWFDAALVIGGVTTGGALAVLYLTKRWRMPQAD